VTQPKNNCHNLAYIRPLKPSAHSLKMNVEDWWDQNSILTKTNKLKEFKYVSSVIQRKGLNQLAGTHMNQRKII
jgi:hypothetical protein